MENGECPLLKGVSIKRSYAVLTLNAQVPVSQLYLSLVHNNDASASEALQASGDVEIDLISIPTSIGQCPTNQIVKKVNIMDII